MNFIHYIKLGAVLLIAVLGFDNYRLNKKVDNLDNALARASVNLHYYESALSGMEKQNKVLQLTVDDFKHSEDSLVQELRKQSKELKIKDKKLEEKHENIIYENNDFFRSNAFFIGMSDVYRLFKF